MGGAGTSNNKAAGGGTTDFAPTISGRYLMGSPIVTTDLVVYSVGSDFDIGPNGTAISQGASAVWLIKSATDCFIRVAADAAPGTDNWYNTGGTAQGDPGTRTGTGTTVFQLNDIPDTVNIYNVVDTTTVPTPDYGNNFSGATAYTSDDKVTFFDPSQDSKYGRGIVCDAECINESFCGDTEDGRSVIQFTFRKSGKNDYTITFLQRARATASVEL